MESSNCQTIAYETLHHLRNSCSPHGETNGPSAVKRHSTLGNLNCKNTVASHKMQNNFLINNSRFQENSLNAIFSPKLLEVYSGSNYYFWNTCFGMKTSIFCSCLFIGVMSFTILTENSNLKTGD